MAPMSLAPALSRAHPHPPVVAHAPAKTYLSAPPMQIHPDGRYTATFSTTEGPLVFDLHPGFDDAREALNGFRFLAREGYYDSTPYFRIVDEFMVEGGTPTGVASNAGYTLPDRPVPPELAPRVPGEPGEPELATYARGVLAMSTQGPRADAPHSTGSQFFVMFADTNLDPEYQVIGKLASGEGTLDRIAKRRVGPHPDPKLNDPEHGPEMSAPLDPVGVYNVRVTGLHGPVPQRPNRH